MHPSPATLLDAELFFRDDCLLGEGPFWHEERLFWVDILNCQLRSCDARGNDFGILRFPSHVGCVAPWGKGFIAGTKEGLGTISIGGSYRPLPQSPVLPRNIRFNDGKLDPAGRFWCGTMDYEARAGMGALYVVEKDGSVREVLDGITIANGLAWDERAGLFYYIDTALGRVDVFDYNIGTGAITNRRVAFRIPAELGLPDGMALDDAGTLWIACWRGAHVLGYDPHSGELRARLRLPTRLSSSCWIHRDRIYVTTARTELNPDQLRMEPLAGSIFTGRLPQP